MNFTYSELAERAGRYAAAFASIATQPVVASLLPTLPKTAAVAFGAMRDGHDRPIAATGFLRIPIPCTSTSMVSPGFINSFGLRP